MKYCVYCGNPLKSTDKYCIICGKPVLRDIQKPKAVQKPKDVIKEKVRETEKKLVDYERKLGEVSEDKSLRCSPEFLRTMKEVYGRLKFEVKHIKPMEILEGLEIKVASDLLWIFGNKKDELEKY